MDTKSKNSHKRGIIITVILLAFCSVMMLSQYDSIRGTVETAPTAYEASFADTLMESSIGASDRIWRKGIIWYIISILMTRILRMC